MTSRYDRQERVENWDQKKLTAATVKIVGCGALGNVVAPQLVAMGVGTIELYDDDTIEKHNLARQWLFREIDIGEPKAEVLEARLKERNSEIVITGFVDRITEDSYEFALEDADVIVDCVDNIRARYWLNKYAIDNDVPLVHMGTSPLGGEISVITKETACLNCTGYFEDLEIETPESCINVKEPSVATTNGIIGSLGADQVRMIIMKLPEEKNSLIKPTLYLKIRHRDKKLQQVFHEKKEDCKICGNGKK